MARTLSVKKNIRIQEKKRERNHARKSRIRTFVKKFEKDLENKQITNHQEATDRLRLVQKEIYKGASKGVVHKNTASRKYSRLCLRVNKLFGLPS